MSAAWEGVSWGARIRARLEGVAICSLRPEGMMLMVCSLPPGPPSSPGLHTGLLPRR